jgi:uncharacterized protein (DUF433 family)
MPHWRDHISIDPAIHHGDPCIRGTRVPVSVIVGSIADGDTAERIIQAYPTITREGIQAALKFAAEAVSLYAISVNAPRMDGSIRNAGLTVQPP